MHNYFSTGHGELATKGLRRIVGNAMNAVGSDDDRVKVIGQSDNWAYTAEVFPAKCTKDSEVFNDGGHGHFVQNSPLGIMWSANFLDTFVKKYDL